MNLIKQEHTLEFSGALIIDSKFIKIIEQSCKIVELKAIITRINFINIR